MTDSILTAVVAPVPIGLLEVEGLLFEDKSFGITIQQCALLFQVRQDNAQRDFKALLSKDSKFVKTKVKDTYTRKPENSITLIEFERLLRKLDRKGNLHAQKLVDDLVGLSLKQLFSDAFKIKFEQEERQQELIDRQLTKDSFWWLVPEIQKYIEEHGSSNPQFHYVNSFKAMSVGLFGKEPNQIKAELGLGKNDLNRDHFNSEALRRIDIVQRLAKVNLENGERPMEAVKSAIKTFNYSPINYKN